MDFTVISVVVIFLLIIVLILQVQMNDLSKRIDDLIKEKEESKVS